MTGDLCTKNALDQNYDEFEFFKVTFKKKTSWPCEGHVTNAGLFLSLPKRNQNGGLSIEPN